MNRKTRWLGAGIVVAVLTAGWWWLERSTRPAAVDVPPGITEPAGEKSALLRPITTNAGQALVPSEGSVEPAIEAASGAEGARPSVGDILSAPDDDYVRVASKLLKITLDAGAPMVEREEALAHALNLSAGHEAEVLTPLVTDKNLPDEFAETVLAEALNRPLDFQADLYMAALGARTNPELKQKIREHLAFLTGGDDLGPNPADWQKAIQAAKASWPK